MTLEAKVGSYRVYIEQPETSGSFLATSKEWTTSAKGAYDFMNLVKKTALACGDTVTAGIVGAYTAVSSVPYFFSLVAGFPGMIKGTFNEKMTAYRATEFGHNITEFCAMGLFSASVFNPANKVLGNVGTIFDALSDMFEVPKFASDAYEAWQVSRLAADSSPEVQSGLSSRFQHSMIKLVKSVSASANGFFASYAVVYGAALVTAATALTFSLTATVCNVTDYYHQNYLSGHVVKKITLEV